MTTEEIIENILIVEGPGNAAKNYLIPGDKGGRTNWGISERAHSEEWANGKVPTKERARAIYAAVYAAPWTEVLYPALRAQLVDWTVLHGQGRTDRWLARMLFTSTDLLVNKHGVCVARLNQLYAQPGVPRHLNNSLVAFRLKMIDEISDADVSQKANEEGWENRALKFLLG